MLGPEQVERIALLARLSLTDEEQERFARQLSAVLEYAEQLAAVDVEGIPPTATVVPMHSIMRTGDEPGGALPREQMLRNAPRSDGASFEVPAALGDEE